MDYLESVDVFRDLSAGEVESIGHKTTLMTYQAGHLFYMPDDPGEALFILKQGRVQLYRMSADGRKFVLAVLHPGAVFGHMALVGQRLHNTFAEALDDCVICVWSREEVRHLLMEKPQVALRFLEVMSERLFLAEERLEEIAFKRIPARVASLLIHLDDEHGGSGRLTGYTHQYLADMLGTYRETVTQTLNEFKSEQLIRIGRKSIEILDVPGLQIVAELGA
ncbi:MAG: Crp/Fnr family transcriptional regulator [Anaerolineae bacterium]|nr:Crp/Fnr family transcriptional regulator [Anaerolineae bacterium]